MTRRRCFCIPLLFAAQILHAEQSDDFAERVAGFHRPWDEFLRIFLGCPKGAHEVDECRRDSGHIERPLFSRARKAAMRLFDLVDR